MANPVTALDVTVAFRFAVTAPADDAFATLCPVERRVPGPHAGIQLWR